MIYTLTLNPSLDYVMHLDAFHLGALNRSYKEELFPGGKGINISIVLNHLRISNRALGFIAGFTGKEIENKLKQLSIDTDFILLDRGTSRINVKLEANEETEINGTGPQITPSDLKQLFYQLEQIEEGDFLILAGSIPRSVPTNIYKEILKNLSDKKIHVVVDATKELLLSTLPYKPFLIKPNHMELAETFGVTLYSDDDIIRYAHKLQEMGAQNVLVSMGGDGSLLITSTGKVIKSICPEGKAINTVGSGDAMVAGFIAGYLKSKDFDEALKLATAAGSATAFSSWLATADEIDKLV